MQKLVIGQYDDPNSFRSLVFITPDEFRVMITALQNHYKQIELLYAIPDDELFKIIDFSKLSEYADEKERICTEKELLAASRKYKENVALDYNILYNILQDINQPYPGANYGQSPLN